MLKNNDNSINFTKHGNFTISCNFKIQSVKFQGYTYSNKMKYF